MKGSLVGGSNLNPRVLSSMYRHVGLKKKDLYGALRELGTVGMSPLFRDTWTPDNPTTGNCYHVSEMVRYYLAPHAVSHVLHLPAGGTHWYLTLPKLVDLTVDQFDTIPDYSTLAPMASNDIPFCNEFGLLSAVIFTVLWLFNLFYVLISKRYEAV